MELPAGRYDRVLDAGLERALAAGLIGHLEDIDAADVPHRLAGHVAQAIRARLPDISAEEQTVLVADLLGILGAPDRLLAGEKPQRLVAVSSRAGVDPPVAPDIPLSEHDLLVNARGEPHLAAELRRSSRPRTRSTSSWRSSAGPGSGSCSTSSRRRSVAASRYGS